VVDSSFLRFSGKTALITGGANGIGKAIAWRLAELGAGIVIVDRDPGGQAAMERLAAEFPSTTPVECFQADVNDRAALEAVRNRLRDAGRGLDILVPNAGINIRLPTLEITLPQVQSIVETNLVAVISTLQVFVPLLFGREAPRVVITGSLAAEHGMVLRSTYAATKAGVSGLTRALAVEWGPQGITVNAVGPGIINTQLVQGYMRQHPERVAATLGHTPLRRIGEPSEVADAVAFLASHAARFITGQTLFVDGGISAGSDWW
jgi:gluconate 5-dehydrogenase